MADTFLNAEDILKEAQGLAESQGCNLNETLMDAYKDFRRTCFHTEAMGRVYSEVIGCTAEQWTTFQMYMWRAVKRLPGIDLSQVVAYQEPVNV